MGGVRRRRGLARRLSEPERQRGARAVTPVPSLALGLCLDAPLAALRDRPHNPPFILGSGSLSFGFGLKLIPSPAQLAQFAVPLLICGLFVWREASRERQVWVR